MQLKRKNIMGKESRPCNEDVKELTDLFVYMYLMLKLGRNKTK